MASAKILVIEDNEMNMILFRDLLTLEGYQVLGAVDTEDGIQIAREQSPDLVLMDIQLPGMDGLSATRIMKNDPELKGIPVVALTSYAMQGDMEKAIAAGCDEYLTKPIDTKNFTKTVSQFIKPSKLNKLEAK